MRGLLMVVSTSSLSLEVDLSKSDLDDSSSSPLPDFSIRDYVFNTRSKDIENHWPFSPEILQLCHKHGVKDILPPFEPSTVISSAKNISNSGVNRSEFGDHRLCVSSNNVDKKLKLDTNNIEASGSEEDTDNENPLTWVNRSSSGVNSVPTSQSAYLEAEAENSPQPSPEKPETSVIPASINIESNSQALIKTCRSIVKLSRVAVPKANDVLSVSTSVVSESMASKVCPICKTFSSSSNTTLNAHIDQCLSGESTIKWTANAKAVKHRIKPRKTRFMMDIYATALECTLEDLDRRNGTNWALSLDNPVWEVGAFAEEKNCASSAVNVEDKNDKGAVYFDSNGTKLRILSKFSDQKANLKSDDLGPRKLVKIDEASKAFSAKKKKPLLDKHKLLKLPSREKSCSPRYNYHPEGVKSREREFSPEEEEEEPSRPHVNQMKFNGFGNIKQWVGSKRTVIKKKIDLECGNQRPDKIVKNLRPNRHLPSVVDKLINRKCDLTFKRSEDLASSSNDKYMEQPCPRKSMGASLLESRECCGKKNCPCQCDVQSRKDGPTVHKHNIDSPDGAKSHASSRSSKKMRTGDGDSSFVRSRISQLDVSLKGENFGSLKKMASDNVLSVKIAPHTQSKNSGKKLNFKKHRMHRVCRSEDEAALASVPTVPGHDSQVDAQGKNASQVEKMYPKLLMDRAMNLKNQKGIGRMVSISKEGDMSSNGSGAQLECDSYATEKIGSFVADDGAAGTASVPNPVQEVSKPASTYSAEKACVMLGSSFNSRSPVLAGLSDAMMNSQEYPNAYQEHCPDDLVSVGKQEHFCVDKVGEGMAASNADPVAEGNASEEAQGSYFVDVDPIPIPGPPGSFLPSPRRMDSEELQGNSSLTTCRIVSSEDERELVVDMDMLDSPISATSFASNSVAARSDSVSFANITMQSEGIQHNAQRDICEDRIDPIVEGSLPFEKASVNGKAKRDVSGTNMNIKVCCCSRKEGVIRNDTLDDHDSELLRERMMSFLPQLACRDKQMEQDQSNEFCGSHLQSGTLLQRELMPEGEKALLASTQKGHTPAVVSYCSEAKFHSYSNCESPSPSTTSNVLRLMGKNLMVVNKVEDRSPEIAPTRSKTLDNVASRQSRFGTGGNVNSTRCSLHNALSQRSTILGNSQAYLDFKTPDLYPFHPRIAVPSSKRFGEGLTPSLQCHEYRERCNLVTSLHRSHHTLDGYQVERAEIPKEMILLDDSSITATGDKVKCMEVARSPVHFSTSMPFTNRFYNHQPSRIPHFSRGTGSQSVQNADTGQAGRWSTRH